MKESASFFRQRIELAQCFSIDSMVASLRGSEGSYELPE